MINWVEDTILQLKRLGELLGRCQGAGVPQEGGSDGENGKRAFCKQDHFPLNTKSGSTSSQWGRRTPSMGALGSSLGISGPQCLCHLKRSNPSGTFQTVGAQSPTAGGWVCQSPGFAQPTIPQRPQLCLLYMGVLFKFCLEKYLLLPNSLKISRLDDLVSSKCQKNLWIKAGGRRNSPEHGLNG